MPTEGNRALVVDNESLTRELLSGILESEGFEVESTPHANEALSLLSTRHEFSFLFTDLSLHPIDGIELIREAVKISPSLIPIAMTSTGSLESARAAVKEGAYDYVLKPFSLAEIKVSVSNALERHRLQTENSRLRELTEMFRMSEAIATIRDEKKLFDFVLQGALSRVGAERGSLMTTSPDGDHLEMVASVGLPEEATRTVHSDSESISGWVAKHALPLCVDDIELDQEFHRMGRGLEDGAFMSLPLERKLTKSNRLRRRDQNPEQRVMAVLNVNRKKDRETFTPVDAKVLSIVANHAAVALENLRLIEDVEHAHLSTLQSMARVLEAKDPYTHGHSERVRNYSVMAARKLGMNNEDVETLRLGAMLHDVGKIGVNDEILHKTDKLSDEEWEEIKKHPVIGYEVLQPVGFLTDAHLELVRSHHERIDGTGYPEGLKGSNVSDLVRVIGAADTYDAMSGDRAYRKGMSPECIAEEFRRLSGSQFDERVAKLFVELIESGEIERYATYEPRV